MKRKKKVAFTSTQTKAKFRLSTSSWRMRETIRKTVSLVIHDTITTNFQNPKLQSGVSQTPTEMFPVLEPASAE